MRARARRRDLTLIPLLTGVAPTPSRYAADKGWKEVATSTPFSAVRKAASLRAAVPAPPDHDSDDQSALLDSEVGAPTRRLPPGAKAKVARAMSDIARSFADGDDSNRPSRL